MIYDPTFVATGLAIPVGPALLHDPLLNKGTAFTERERSAYGLRGLLPPHVHTIEEQVQRVMDNYRHKENDLERYVHLSALQDRNETLFYKVVTEHIEEMMPIIYTPTVGLACQQWGHLFRRARGLYVSLEDRGRIRELLHNHRNPHVGVIVVTDGERILGLGDQGVGGMGIPIGKLALYTACAGIHPSLTLPVTLDVGTEHEEYLRDPLYMGLRRRRLRGAEYDAFVEEFVQAVQEVMPRALVQFEDFANVNAFRLLATWRDRVCCFNDDIQGTAAVTLAGLYTALRITRKTLREQKILFEGAGEAGVGIADLVVSALVDEGATVEEARSRCWFVDSHGLVVKGRADLAEHKLRFAHPHEKVASLIAAVEALRPTALVGVSANPGSFDRPVLEAMARCNERPIVFALSNPTSKAECSAAEAWRFTGGRAIFASGSPFPPFSMDGRTLVPGQGNNAYVFPGVGLGIVASHAKRVTDRMFAAAARALAAQVQPADLEVGRIYPSLRRIREVSAHIGAAVAEVAFQDGLAGVTRPASALELVKSHQWEPRYRRYA